MLHHSILFLARSFPPSLLIFGGFGLYIYLLCLLAFGPVAIHSIGHDFSLLVSLLVMIIA